jgi:ZIP family zinc transporter
MNEYSAVGASSFPGTRCRGVSADTVAATTAIGAGAILSMLADTMIPEAFEETHDFAALITVEGFLAAFVLSKLGE